MKKMVTYKEAFELFNQGRISKETFEKVRKAHDENIKRLHEKQSAEVLVKPHF